MYQQLTNDVNRLINNFGKTITFYELGGEYNVNTGSIDLTNTGLWYVDGYIYESKETTMYDTYASEKEFRVVIKAKDVNGVAISDNLLLKMRIDYTTGQMASVKRVTPVESNGVIMFYVLRCTSA